MGFFPRTGFFSFGPFFRYNFLPESKKINRHGPGFRSRNYLDTGGNLTDREIALNYSVQFLNGSDLQFEFQDTYISLFADFDPTRSADPLVVPLPAGKDYNWQACNIMYQSDSRKDFSFDIEANYGGFYNGTGLGLSGRVGYRIRPLFNLSISYAYNNIELPNPYPDGSFFLVGPRIDLTFTDKIYWTNYIQYNEQANNININSRFQWRFAPVSDLFLVYTENYLPIGFQTKNRGFVLKISYWINV
jgi:hypothetical protein